MPCGKTLVREIGVFVRKIDDDKLRKVLELGKDEEAVQSADFAKCT